MGPFVWLAHSLFFRAKMPFILCLGWNWTKAHSLSRRRFIFCQLFKHVDGLIFEKDWEVTYFSNFSIATFLVFSPYSHKISWICVTIFLDGYSCGSYLGLFFTMVGTRSGISTTVSSKKEKTKMRTKDVKEKGLVPESNKHGVRSWNAT